MVTALLLLEAPHQTVSTTTPSSPKQLPSSTQHHCYPFRKQGFLAQTWGSHHTCSLTASSDRLGITSVMKEDLEQQS